VPFDNHGPKSAQLLKNATLRAYDGLSHGMAATHPELINGDLLDFARS
jgi:non-heme chloroperoxidase